MAIPEPAARLPDGDFLTRAFVVPFAVFLGFLAVSQLWEGVWADARFAVYPAQTVACGGMLWHYRKAYTPWTTQGFAAAVGTGLIVLGVWVAPQFLFPNRTDGFDPTRLSATPVLQGLTVAFRFLRLTVVVPLLEEGFWRGFLLRRLIRTDFWTVPFGSFTWSSCGITAVLFAAEHQPADWPAGLLAGLAYNGVAYRTRTLSACVAAHAVTNLGLGLYVCATRQWGFW
ncbi:MAG TPA: CAAX prenyl protease-related protein [Chthoniobacterales bacterium]